MCGRAFADSDAIVAISGIPIGKADLFAPYQDAGMHTECFLKWHLRESFIHTFDEHYDQHLRGMRVMQADGSIEEREPHSGQGGHPDHRDGP